MNHIIVVDTDNIVSLNSKENRLQLRNELYQLQQDGCHLVLTTKGPISRIISIAKELDMKKYHGFLIAYDGCIVIDCSTGERLYENTISIPTTKKLIQHAQQLGLNPIVEDGFQIYTDHADNYSVSYESITNHLNIHLVDDIAESIDFQPARILIAAPHEVLASCLEACQQPFLNRLSFTLLTPFYLQVTPLGVYQDYSLQLICRKLKTAWEDVKFKAT